MQEISKEQLIIEKSKNQELFFHDFIVQIENIEFNLFKTNQKIYEEFFN